MDSTLGARTDTVIIGGGQAGLALGYHLSRQGRDFVILDEHERVGDAWRSRWDSLRLFTPASFDGLPGLPFPGPRSRFPTKDEQADYLERYAAAFELPVRTGVRARRVTRDPVSGRFTVGTDDGDWGAANVVVATGAQQLPRLPQFAPALGGDIRQLHSSAYRNPGRLRDGPVLVVGLGNSGAEIAYELAPTRPTLIAGAPSAELPFRHGGPVTPFALPVVRAVALHLLTLGTPIGRRVHATGHRAAPLIRRRLRDLAAAGVERVPRITGVERGRPVAADGRVLDVANVIWCTGYRREDAWIELPVFDEAGVPLQRRGVAEAAPGLYFLGLDFLYSAASETIPGSGRDARHLARHMAAPAGAAGRSARRSRPRSTGR